MVYTSRLYFEQSSLVPQRLFKRRIHRSIGFRFVKEFIKDCDPSAERRKRRKEEDGLVNETAEFNVQGLHERAMRGQPRANRGASWRLDTRLPVRRAQPAREQHREEETLLAAAITIAASQTEKFKVTIAADASTHT